MIDKHKHCPMCGTPIPMSEQFCSPKCEQIAVQNQNKIRKTRFYLYVVFAIFIIVFLYFTLRGKLF